MLLTLWRMKQQQMVAGLSSPPYVTMCRPNIQMPGILSIIPRITQAVVSFLAKASFTCTNNSQQMLTIEFTYPLLVYFFICLFNVMRFFGGFYFQLIKIIVNVCDYFALMQYIQLQTFCKTVRHRVFIFSKHFINILLLLPSA